MQLTLVLVDLHLLISEVPIPFSKSTSVSVQRRNINPLWLHIALDDPAGANIAPSGYYLHKFVTVYDYFEQDEQRSRHRLNQRCYSTNRFFSSISFWNDSPSLLPNFEMEMAEGSVKFQVFHKLYTFVHQLENPVLCLLRSPFLLVECPSKEETTRRGMPH